MHSVAYEQPRGLEVLELRRYDVPRGAQEQRCRPTRRNVRRNLVRRYARGNTPGHDIGAYVEDGPRIRAVDIHIDVIDCRTGVRDVRDDAEGEVYRRRLQPDSVADGNEDVYERQWDCLLVARQVEVCKMMMDDAKIGSCG